MDFAHFQYIVIIGCAILNALASLYVLISNPLRRINRFFALFSGGIAIWSFGLALLFFLRNDFFVTLILGGGLILSSGMYYFARVFPEGRLSRTDALFAIPGIIVAFLIPTNAFISGVTYTTAGYIVPHNEKLFGIYMLVAAMYMISGSCLMIKKYLRAEGLARVQLKFFMVGIIAFTGISLVCDAILPNFGIFEFNLLGPFASLLFVGTTAYAIFRYQIMDIRFVIQRGIIYLVFLAIFISLYSAGISFVSYLVREITNFAVIGVAGVTMILGIFFWKPVELQLQKATDHIFFKDRYHYGDILHELSKALRTHVSQTSVIASTSDIFEKIFKPTFVAFRLTDEESMTGPLPSEATAVSIPIIFETRDIGLLELGPKRSGDSYTSTDMTLLKTFSHQAAVALEKGRLYQKVQEYSNHLEQLVDERTGEIRKLQEDQKQAMIDISHNLQTPIAIIKGELELLEEADVDVEKMDTVRKSLDRVSGFIRQLLHLARLDHSAYKVELSPLDLAQIIRDQAEYFEVIGEDQGMHISAQTPEHLKILGNKKLLEELFTNLAVNAIKYRRHDTDSFMKIILKDTGVEAEIIVEDNGIGISAEDLPEIFTRFYTAQRSPNAPQGTGIGLAIVKRIVEKHNGKISLASTPAEGTTFTISLPKL